MSIEEIIEKLEEAVNLGDSPKRGPFGTHIRKEYLVEDIELLKTHQEAQPHEPYRESTGFRVNNDMFGAYAKIQTGASRDLHVYKVIGRIESNSYCDTPIMGGTKAVLHDEIVSVLNVVHCGVSEDKVIRVALDDCEILRQPNEPLTLEELREMDGQPVWLDRGPGYGGHWALVQIWAKPTNIVYLILNNGAALFLRAEIENGTKVYRRPPEED